MTSIFLAKPDAVELRVRLSGLGWVWVWLPTVVACLVIATESTPTFSAQHTSGFLRPIFERWFGPVSDGAWELGHHVFRKSGHFFGYGAVCLTFLRSWLYTLGLGANLSWTDWRRRATMLALASTAVVASCDEIHQRFIPGRQGAVQDVLLDTAGGAFVCGLVWVIFWRKQRTSDAPPARMRQKA